LKDKINKSDYEKNINRIKKLEMEIIDPMKGLPEDVFLLISQFTPLINVDLLIKDKYHRTLLTWREDDFCGTGWHIPGGIIRFKENIADRINAVARFELGCEVEFIPIPLAVNQIIHPDREIRGHFISLLYKCILLTPLNKKLAYISGNPKPNSWKWHSKCPDNIVQIHKIYEQYF